MRADTAFLDLRNIRKSFGDFVALQNINLTIKKGELMCFLGPSGCGKTTLLRLIAGLDVQTAGSIFQADKDISLLPPAQRDYGIVFQSYALFPNLTVAQNVGYGLTNRKLGRSEIANRVTELVKLVGLPGSEPKFPNQLSGGQQQRIALARALASSPGLLLLDEPLSALDALERVRLRGEIRALQQTLGVTTIMVTHDQEEALSIADRIVVMNKGVIEQVGTPSEIYREPASAFVADFVGKVNVISTSIKAGQLQLGTFNIASDRPDSAVKIYLRPEDILARPIAAQDAYQFEALITKIEFLGSFCHVHVSSPVLPQAVVVYMSLNYLSEQSLQTGSTVRLKILPERLKVF